MKFHPEDVMVAAIIKMAAPEAKVGYRIWPGDWALGGACASGDFWEAERARPTASSAWTKAGEIELTGVFDPTRRRRARLVQMWERFGFPLCPTENEWQWVGLKYMTDIQKSDFSKSLSAIKADRRDQAAVNAAFEEALALATAFLKKIIAAP